MLALLVSLIMGGCSITPIAPPPLPGCKEMKPVCFCDTDNSCEWHFECVPYDSEIPAKKLK